MKILRKKKEKKRRVEVVVISDVHLGCSGARAKELLDYLKSIKPQKIILNGDIVDFRHFRESVWPKSHLRVLKYLVALMGKGVQIEYITGNHDEMLHQFALFQHGFFRIHNNLLQELDGKKCWIFHGDVVDVSLRQSGWLAAGHKLWVCLGRLASLVGNGGQAAKARSRADRAAVFLQHFEQTCASTAVAKGCAYVICGHTHYPEIRTITTPNGQLTYLNAGDWVENLTALEYYEGQWHLYRYYHDVLSWVKKEREIPANPQASQVVLPACEEKNWKRA